MLIYKITNIINGLSYIGATKRTAAVRWREIAYSARTNPQRMIAHAIRKDGIENFKLDIIKKLIGQNLEHLKRAERFYISKFNSIKNGYNRRPGGEMPKENCGTSLKGRKMTEEQKQKRSTTLMGHLVSEETKRKISRKNKGKRHKHTEETKKQIAETHKGMHHSEHTKQLIRIARAKQTFPEQTKQKMSESQKHRWVEIKNKKGEI